MTLDELKKLPPDDPLRAEHVLAHLLKNHGILETTFAGATVKACLQNVAAQTVRPSDPEQMLMEGTVAAVEKRHTEVCIAQIAAGVACAFGADNMTPEAIAARACVIFAHIRVELAEAAK